MSTSDAATLALTDAVSPTNPPSGDRLAPESQRDCWRRLQSLVEQRVQAEQQAAEEFRIDTERIERELKTTTATRSETNERERTAIQAEFDAAIVEAGTHYAEDYAVAQQEFQDVQFAIQQRVTDDTETAQKKNEEDRWMVTSYFDEEAEGSPKQQYEVFRSNTEKTHDQLKIEEDELNTLKLRADLLMLKRRQGVEVEPPKPEKIAPTNDLDTASAQFHEACESLKSRLEELGKLKVPALFQGWRPHLLALAGWAVLWGIAGFMIDPKVLPVENTLEPMEWLVVSGILMLFPVGITMGILLSVGRGQSHPIYEIIFEQQLLAQRHRQRWQKLADAEVKHREEKFNAWRKVTTSKREAGLKKADAELAVTLQKVETRRASEHSAANQKYPAPGMPEQILLRQRIRYSIQLKARALVGDCHGHSAVVHLHPQPGFLFRVILIPVEHSVHHRLSYRHPDLLEILFAETVRFGKAENFLLGFVHAIQRAIQRQLDRLVHSLPGTHDRSRRRRKAAVEGVSTLT